MTDIPINITISSKSAEDGGKKASRTLDEIKQKAREAKTATGELDQSLDKFGGTASKVSGIAKQLGTILGTALSARAIINASDSFKELENRLKIASNGVGDINQSFKELYRISQANRTPLEANVTLFQRASIAAKELGASNQQLFQFVDNVSKGLAIQGGSAATASGALLQLGQALGSGIVRAEEFNSILEGAFPIAQAAARGLEQTGGSVAKLRTLIADGQITSDQFFKAILSQSEELSATFALTGVTVGQAMTTLNNSFLTYIGQSTTVSTVTNALSSIIVTAAENFDTLANLVLAVSGALALNYVAALVTATGATLTLSGVVTGLGIALKVALPVAAIAAAIFAVIEYFDELHATMTLVMGTAIKFANTMYSYIVGSLRGIGAAVSNTGDVLGGFLLDMQEFVTNPLGDNAGFDNFKRDLDQGYKGAFKKAFESARAEAREFNEALDESVTDKIKEIAKEAKSTSQTVTESFEQTKPPVIELGKEVDKAKEKTKKLADTAKTEMSPIAEIFKDTAIQIKNAFSNTFESLFKGEINSFEDFASSIKDIFARMLAQMATLAIAKPIIVPIVTALGESIGIGKGDIQSVVGELGGGGSSGASGLLGKAGDLFGGGSGFLSGIKDYINKLGSDLFGTFSGVGPTLPGAADATLTGTLGSTFSGSYGGAIANLLGLGSGNMLVDTGTSLAGAAIGNLIFPGVGGIVGSFAGTALGGLFGGKKKPNPASNAGTTGFNNLGQLTGVELSSKHTDTTAAQGMVDYVNSIGSFFSNSGIDLSGIKSLQTGIDNGTGFFNFGENFKTEKDPNLVLRFDAKDEKKAQEAIGQFAILLANRIDVITDQIDDKTLGIINRIETEGRETQQVMDDIGFALNFEKMFKEAEAPMTNAELAIKAINDNFNIMTETMDRLGYEVSDYTRIEKERAKAIKESKDSLYKASMDAYLKESAPSVLEFGNLYSNYQNQLKEFNSVGLDTTFVTRTFQVQQEKLLQSLVKDTSNERIKLLEDEIKLFEKEADIASRIADDYSSISKSLSDAILNLRISEISPLTNEQRLFEARNAFVSTASKARSGDTDAMKELESLGNQFLAISRDYYASTDAFVSDFNLVQKALEDAKGKADEQITIQKQIAQSAKDQITAINASAATIADALRSQAKVQSIINSALQVSKGNANETLVSGIRAGLLTQDQINQSGSVLKSLGAPSDGKGGNSLFFESNPAANAAFIQFAKSIGIPGFDKGGDVLANGTFLVGERRPEIFQAGGSGGKVIPLENGREVEQRLVNLEKEMAASVRIQQQGFKRMEAAMMKQIDAINTTTMAVKRNG